MNVILNTESVDVVVTSPPYNIGVDYYTSDDSLPRGKYSDGQEMSALQSDEF